MQLDLIHQQKDKVILLIKDTNHVFVNTLRRIIISEVPTMAIEEVSFVKNSSALYDEMLAHRLGLVPLTTDLKSYNLPEECKCESKGCAQCQTTISLKEKGPCIVYSESLKAKDPAIKPVHDKMPMVKLLKEQSMEIEAIAILGTGKKHYKFTPGLAWYRGYPEFVIGDKVNLSEISKRCPALEVKGNKIILKDVTKWNEAQEQICEENNVQIKSGKTDFIFYLESFGQLSPKEILLEATNIIDKKLDDFEKQLKKLK